MSVGHEVPGFLGRGRAPIRAALSDGFISAQVLRPNLKRSNVAAAPWESLTKGEGRLSLSLTLWDLGGMAVLGVLCCTGPRTGGFRFGSGTLPSGGNQAPDVVLMVYSAFSHLTRPHTQGPVSTPRCTHPRTHVSQTHHLL